MLFHRRQHAQITLDTSCVVITDVVLNHLDKFTFAGKPSAVIAFPLQNAPEALHRAVIDAMRHAGHTLRHPSLHKLVVEGTVGVLEPSVAVEQRMRVRIGLHSLVEGFENQWVIVVFAEYVGHDAPVTEIQNGAQVELVDLASLIPLEFCHISEPFFIWCFGSELPIKYVFSYILRVCSLSCASVVRILDS